MKPTAPRAIKKVLKLLQHGKSMRATAKQLNVSHATVRNIAINNDLNLSKFKGGRPRKILASMVDYIKLNMKRGLNKPASEELEQAGTISLLPISIATLRRRLREAGLIAKRIVKRPALKKKHIRRRLQFVHKCKE